MKTPDFGSLVTGFLTIIGLAMACGQYGKLEAWTRNQAADALAWKQGLPYFFALVHGGKVAHPSHQIGQNPYRHPHPVAHL